jgi:hypothetical protein
MCGCMCVYVCVWVCPCQYVKPDKPNLGLRAGLVGILALPASIKLGWKDKMGLMWVIIE